MHTSMRATIVLAFVHILLCSAVEEPDKMVNLQCDAKDVKEESRTTIATAALDDTSAPSAPIVFGSTKCVDMHTMCPTWASVGECDINSAYMHSQCQLSCQLCRSGTCNDNPDVHCSAAKCYKDAEFMMSHCAWTCGMCNLRRGRVQCARNPNELPALVSPTNMHMLPPDGEGTRAVESLDEMFRRIVDSVSEAGGSVTVHSSDPWLISIADFISSTEADAILEAGGGNFHRSLAGDGVNDVRTSSTSWCERQCSQNEVIERVELRVQNLTGIPRANSEWMQVLRYEVGQFYKRHNDMNAPRSSPWGPRMLTAYMYLNDQETSDGGGETDFPRLNVTLRPVKGTLAIWPSVISTDLFSREDRTDHEAMPVKRGVKYGANLWIHMFDFRSLSSKGCENVDYFENWR